MNGNKMSDAEWKMRVHAHLNGLPQPPGPIYPDPPRVDPDATMKLWTRRLAKLAGVLLVIWAFFIVWNNQPDLETPNDRATRRVSPGWAVR